MYTQKLMPDLIVLFNHTLSEAQQADAHESLGVERIVEPPEEIKNTWSQVPPEPGDVSGWLALVRHWLAAAARPGDFVLIQGEFGATFQLVNFCLESGFVPIYSTTRRKAGEAHLPDGSVAMRHVFTHVRFRRYGR